MNFSNKLLFCFCVLLFGTSQMAKATHYRAGEVIYKLIGPFKYEVQVITYAKISYPSNLADKDEVAVLWGDDTADTLVRVNGPDLDGNGIPDGEDLGNDIRKNVYVGVHTYPGAPPPPNRFYVLQFQDLNRMANIINIANGASDEIPFYVEDTIKFPTDLANIGFNSSPELTCPPIDYANLYDTFYHNPCPIDVDGDSLDFELMICLQGPSSSVPQYIYPDVFCRTIGQNPNTLTIDRHTGQVTWATPCRQGIFNIAIIVHEYRNGINLGTLMRDMQIIVLSENNNPPLITSARDTCVRAGETLNVRITARDSTYPPVVLTANGGAFQVATNSATFTNTSGGTLISGNPAIGVFNWNTDCSHIQGQPYQVVFKAADSYVLPGSPPQPAALVDIETWRIRVIAPPPLNLVALATNRNVTLRWDSLYLCASSPDFRGFSVWRKAGCDLFTPDYCETGLAVRGFTRLTVANIFNYRFVDNTSVVGQQYTYRVVAHFSKLSPNGLFQFNANESVPSNGVCVFMPVNVPVIINVDVQQTDVSNGRVFVRWTKPLAGGNNLDTIQYPPPYRFDLYRGNGFNLGSPVLIFSTPDAASFAALNDTSFTDIGLNTQDSAWSYKVVFYSNNDTVGYTSVASSVYLNVQPSGQSLFLSWSENVPWRNDSFEVFKLNKLTSLFAPVDTVYNHFFTDTGLINDSLYCYFVRAYGHYDLTTLPRPLINNSQEDCGIPVDTVPPCPVTLVVTNDCDQYNNLPWVTNDYINHLSWSIQNDPCSDDINRYYLYFGPDSANMVVIDSLLSKADTIYTHVLNESLAGCYAVTALDRVGNESLLSNVVCIDNCPYYVLPNAFTPNGDGANDKFTPFKPYRFVPKIEMKIFNRWGELVFKTEDPEINWDGNDLNGKPVNEGVYVYHIMDHFVMARHLSRISGLRAIRCRAIR